MPNLSFPLVSPKDLLFYQNFFFSFFYFFPLFPSIFGSPVPPPPLRANSPSYSPPMLTVGSFPEDPLHALPLPILRKQLHTTFTLFFNPRALPWTVRGGTALYFLAFTILSLAGRSVSKVLLFSRGRLNFQGSLRNLLMFGVIPLDLVAVPFFFPKPPFLPSFPYLFLQPIQRECNCFILFLPRRVVHQPLFNSQYPYYFFLPNETFLWLFYYDFNMMIVLFPWSLLGVEVPLVAYEYYPSHSSLHFE